MKQRGFIDMLGQSRTRLHARADHESCGGGVCLSAGVVTELPARSIPSATQCSRRSLSKSLERDVGFAK